MRDESALGLVSWDQEHHSLVPEPDREAVSQILLAAIAGTSVAYDATRSMAKNILLTGGRAAATLDLARSFAAAGHQVFVAESFRAPLTRFSSAVNRSFRVPSPRYQPLAFARALDELTREHAIDLVVPTCEEIFFVAHASPILTRRCQIFCESLAVLRELHSKHRVQRHVAAAGLRALPTLRLLSPGDLRDLDLQKGVLKPEYSRFGSRVMLSPTQESSRELAISPKEPWVWQPRLRGQEYCTYSVAVAGTLRAHATYLKGGQQASRAAVAFEPVDHEEIHRWVARFVRAQGFTGQIAFDLIEDPEQGLHAVECNPRATSGVHLFRGSGELAEAFLDGDLDRCVVPRGGSVEIITAALLLYGPRWQGPGLERARSVFRWARLLGRGRDVVSRRGDRRPGVGQFVLLSEVLGICARQGCSLTDATTADIEWDGSDLPELTPLWKEAAP